MRVVFGGWKYILNNLWYILLFAVLPGIFLALSVDYTALHNLAHAFFTGDPHVEFIDCLRAWSFVRFDSPLGAIFSACAFIVCAVFMSVLLAFVEKHMRIGKRTLSGIWSQFVSLLPVVFFAELLFVALFEVWAVVLSAVLYAVSALPSRTAVYLLYILVVCAAVYVLLYLVTVIYLFLPCKQSTCFRTYDAFLYSYRLVTRVRGRLLLSMLLSYAVLFCVFCGLTFAPAFLFRIVAAVLYALLFLSFGVRMETVYFYTDKLDREDILKSYREL